MTNTSTATFQVKSALVSLGNPNFLLRASRRMTASLESVMPAQYGLGEHKPANTKLRWLYLPFMLLLALGCMVLATQRIAAATVSGYGHFYTLFIP